MIEIEPHHVGDAENWPDFAQHFTIQINYENLQSRAVLAVAAHGTLSFAKLDGFNLRNARKREVLR